MGAGATDVTCLGIGVLDGPTLEFVYEPLSRTLGFLSFFRSPNRDPDMPQLVLTRFPSAVSRNTPAGGSRFLKEKNRLVPPYTLLFFPPYSDNIVVDVVAVGITQ